MTTVKQILAKQEQEEVKARAKAWFEIQRQRIYEAEKLTEARECVLNALEGFEVTDNGSNLKVKVKSNWTIYVTVEYHTRDVWYCDEMDPEPTRCLEIGIGFYTNDPKLITSPENFAKNFVRFLTQEGLV